MANTPAASLLRLALQAVFRPGDPVGLLSLLKHPLLSLGLERTGVRHAAEIVELVACAAVPAVPTRRRSQTFSRLGSRALATADRPSGSHA
ncbi:hypothetical protein AJ88_02600 [Mesorhizobium amorphae CCBAU 01583]|nr:hypothetical protein AJ88_02600 [Mesorhizobium amorphae CCBAU 01583]